MRVLIGTPIHESKDYAMERWLENVSKMDYPADLMMVDSSFDTDYVSKVKEYCSKLGITKYKLTHIDVPKFQPFAEKIGRSREVIRQEILKNDYDAWLSWGCDKIIPTDSLTKLSAIMEAGNYKLIGPSTWGKDRPLEPSVNFGCALIARDCLEKYGFSLEYPDMPDCWGINEDWFIKRVIRDGGSFIEVYGLIEPIHHLKK